MRGSRPRIGVTGPNKGGYPAWFFTRLVIFLAGGRAVRVRPAKPPEIATLDGLVLGGGADVDPERYGHAIDELRDLHPVTDKRRRLLVRILTHLLAPLIGLIRKIGSLSASAIDHERDELEEEFLAGALERELPVLGICRGAQFINVHFQGTLHQDIRDFYGEEPKIDSVYPRKEVEILPSTRLHEILGRDTCFVNSLHNQAADRVGEGLRVAARERSGVVQGIEAVDHDFLIGVQWHPEYLPQLPEQRGIFRSLVDEARERVLSRADDQLDWAT